MNTTSLEQARFNMVEQQIRTWEVLDQAVLDLLFTVKREDFVPPAYRAIAFTDMEIPLGHGEAMMAPKLEARIVQELAPAAGESVLEVGTGSGYLTALLARRSAHVTSVDIHDDFREKAAANLAAAGIANVSLLTGDAGRDPSPAVDPAARFDVIVLGGSVPVAPEKFIARLNPGGRLFAVVGDLPVMEATRYAVGADGSRTAVALFETVLKPLVHAEAPSRFTF